MNLKLLHIGSSLKNWLNKTGRRQQHWVDNSSIGLNKPKVSQRLSNKNMDSLSLIDFCQVYDLTLGDLGGILEEEYAIQLLERSGFTHQKYEYGECWSQVIALDQESFLPQCFKNSLETTTISHVYFEVYPTKYVQFLTFIHLPTNQEILDCPTYEQEDYQKFIYWIEEYLLTQIGG